MKENQEICAACLFRRDVARFNKFMEDPADFYAPLFTYPFNIPRCMKHTEYLCLGAIIHVVNMAATMQLPADIKEIAIQYEPDFRLIFASNSEFIRYHRGEDFGSLEWIERQMSYQFSLTQEEEEEEAEPTQLSLF